MPPALAFLDRRLATREALARHGWSRIALVATIHGAAAVVMWLTEETLLDKAAFVLAWGFLNFLLLAALRRPVLAGAFALALITVLVLLSRLKHSILFMTVNFVDLMIIDTDTFGFLMTVVPGLAEKVATGLAVAALALAAVWWLDSFRVRLRSATFGCAVSLAGLTGLSLSVDSDPYNEFTAGQYVSKFARSGIVAVGEYLDRGLLEADAQVNGTLGGVADASCTTAHRPPNIVMVFDESSFDLTAMPGVRAPAGYREHFASLDGKARRLVVEGVGGPSWYTEYNVLTGLSVRSYGRFADFVTRIAAGRVERGLPHALRRCGYRTFSLYSFMGAFLSARRFHETTGIEHFYDSAALGAKGVEPDSFYYDAAARIFGRERGRQPLFLMVYTLANHFPWDYRFRPELTPGWRDPGNGSEADEYLRRQMLSKRHYGEFVARLAREFPHEPFLIVRFGDHQPAFARTLIDPKYDESFVMRQMAAHDPRFLTTYYAIDAINFTPRDLGLAHETLDAPYLPLVVLEAAGLPLDPSFAEQKRILQGCRGLFYRCRGGAEARRFNRLLIDAGLIKGL
ncbi:MAG: phosphoglycerol transferase [Bradyrhizobiaceae bacterium]|nr:MAG: phosphoglycerol transferase [Bradyrhizobiaceae bacterium]